MTLLMVIIYLVMGFGAFWVLNEEKKHFEMKIMKWTEDSVTNDENLDRMRYLVLCVIQEDLQELI